LIPFSLSKGHGPTFNRRGYLCSTVWAINQAEKPSSSTAEFNEFTLKMSFAPHILRAQNKEGSV